MIHLQPEVLELRVSVHGGVAIGHMPTGIVATGGDIYQTGRTPETFMRDVVMAYRELCELIERHERGESVIPEEQTAAWDAKENDDG